MARNIRCVKKYAYNAQYVRGFSLIETLVAISLLLLAITGTLTIASRSISFSADARNQVTASFLAEEAIEFVRNTRDNNILSGAGWLSGLSACVNSSCTVDIPNNVVNACTAECPAILLSDAGLYNYSAGSDTIWRREVRIQEITPDKEVIARVTLRWKKQLVDRSFTVEEHLLNWQ